MSRNRPLLPSLPLLWSILGAFCFLPAHAADGTEIRVHADSLMEKASREVFGNSVIFDGGTMGFNEWVSNQAEYEEAVRTWNYYLPYLSEMGPTVLRYPGGLTANDFYWKDGIGPLRNAMRITWAEESLRPLERMSSSGIPRNSVRKPSLW